MIIILPVSALIERYFDDLLDICRWHDHFQFSAGILLWRLCWSLRRSYWGYCSCVSQCKSSLTIDNTCWDGGHWLALTCLLILIGWPRLTYWWIPSLHCWPQWRIVQFQWGRQCGRLITLCCSPSLWFVVGSTSFKITQDLP